MIFCIFCSLCASVLSSFAFSSLMNEKKKFVMEHIQNATLAGGVAIGACADLMVQPWAALLVGTIAGTISVYGFDEITVCIFLKKVLKNVLHSQYKLYVFILYSLPSTNISKFMILAEFTISMECLDLLEVYLVLSFVLPLPIKRLWEIRKYLSMYLFFCIPLFTCLKLFMVFQFCQIFSNYIKNLLSLYTYLLIG